MAVKASSAGCFAMMLLGLVGLCLHLKDTPQLPGRALRSAQERQSLRREQTAWTTNTEANEAIQVDKSHLSHGNVSINNTEAANGPLIPPEDEVHSLISLEAQLDDECHCASVLNGSKGPVDLECVQKCSSDLYHSESASLHVHLQDGPLVLSDHNEL
ncbi:unnamed protein product [Effrenium voratum]|nr:unnamed protein product [Effrenium voratum]CAJ1437203.1 unnamed protein product [Effrenium voratum]